MNLAIDLILVAIVLIGIIMGIKRGFVKTVAKPVKLVAVWVCSFQTCSAFASKFIEPAIGSSVTGRLASILRERFADMAPQSAKDDLPLVLKIAAGIFDIDVGQIANDSGAAFADQLAATFAGPLVSIVSLVISFVLLLIIYSLLFTVVIWILNAIFHIGPLSWLNKILGLVFGFAFSFILAWIVSMVVGFVFGLDIVQIANFEGGTVYNFFREYHPLDLLLGL